MAGAAGIQNPVVVYAEITGDATGGDDYTLTRDAALYDVVVIATATSGGGTMTVGNAANAVTDAIACAVNDAVARAATIDTTFQQFNVGDLLRFTANGAADRGRIFVTLIPTPVAGISPLT